jgi:hypothetical protein
MGINDFDEVTREEIAQISLRADAMVIRQEAEAAKKAGREPRPVFVKQPEDPAPFGQSASDRLTRYVDEVSKLYGGDRELYRELLRRYPDQYVRINGGVEKTEAKVLTGCTYQEADRYCRRLLELHEGVLNANRMRQLREKTFGVKPDKENQQGKTV